MNKLQQKRKEAGLTQAELAKMTGTSLRMIQYYEQGRNDLSKASVETALKIARALECKIEDII